MNILQFNVRLAEGRAAGVALDLHQHAPQQGLASRFVYSCNRGGKESVSYQNYPQVTRHTSRMTAMADIVSFRLLSHGLLGNFDELYYIITRIPGPVILHSHVLHSYWLNLKNMMCFCEKVENHKPDVTPVWTLCDYWNATGRRALTDGREDWRTGCQEYPILNNYSPAKTDHVHQLAAGKRQLLHEMLVLDCQFTPPSQHVVDAFNSLHGPGRCRIINNGIDMATETILADLFLVHETQDKPKIAVVAYDLRYDGKTNQQLVHKMTVSDNKIELHTFGKSSLFTVGNVINYGFETDRRKLMNALSQMDVLVFSPRTGNYPLTLREALSTGMPVITTHGDMAHEALQKSGGKTVSEEDMLQLVQLSKSEIVQAILGTTLAESSQCSCAAYSGQQMLEEHINFYQNPQLPAAAADLPAGQRRNRPV